MNENCTSTVGVLSNGGEGVGYLVDVNAMCEGRDVGQARFVLTRRDAIRILELSALVVKNDLYCVERFDNHVGWLDYDDRLCRTQGDCLRVGDSWFEFSAYEKCTDIEVHTERCSLCELAVKSGLSSPKQLMEQAGER